MRRVCEHGGGVVEFWWYYTGSPPGHLDFCLTDRQTCRDVATIALTLVPYLLPGAPNAFANPRTWTAVLCRALGELEKDINMGLLRT